MSDDRPHRFYDSRQKYLGFVTTTNEKWTIGQRISAELAHLAPQPPALRIFDAGIGDGAVQSHVLRAAHERFPHVPVLSAGKEISVEDLRMALEKLPDRLVEHGPSVFVFTNMTYARAPSLVASKEVQWIEAPLVGTSSHGFSAQLRNLDQRLVDAWRVTSSASGNPLPAQPAVLVVYRDDHAFMLDDVKPRQGEDATGYDLVIASQPWRARTDAETKARNVLLPMTTALGPGGRLVVVQSVGGDPGEEIIRNIWDKADLPDLFPVDRYDLLRALGEQLEDDDRFDLSATPDSESLVSFRMHTLPEEIGPSIGTSALHAAWNAATYVAQIDEKRMSAVPLDGDHLDGVAEVLRRYGGLWFNDEVFVIRRVG